MPETMDRPFWWDAAEPQAAEYESLPDIIDVAIIGGGYTGMGAAIPLARAGRQVAGIEREPQRRHHQRQSALVVFGTCLKIRHGQSQGVLRRGRDRTSGPVRLHRSRKTGL